MQIAFPQPVQLAYVQVGIDGEAVDGSVCLYARPLAAPIAGRFVALASKPVPAPLGRLHQLEVGRFHTDKLILRGRFQDVTVRCVGAPLSTVLACRARAAVQPPPMLHLPCRHHRQ